MDIIKRVRPLKVSYAKLTYRSKTIIVTLLVSLAGVVAPQVSHIDANSDVKPGLVFKMGEYQNYFAEIDRMKAEAAKQQAHEDTVKELRKQLTLNQKLEDYLRRKNSPLADYSSILLEQNNWKKIIALSNAESSLCRRYPVASANCWGVGGSNLWDMGNNLGEGVVGMNRFLNNYPIRSQVKYSQMSFENMNGLYKQPAADHWVRNNMVIYNELTALEHSVTNVSYGNTGSETGI
jgi:hypothetical protein